eukprot:364805-Chlamydomonas_euryale.AAC.9
MGCGWVGWAGCQTVQQLTLVTDGVQMRRTCLLVPLSHITYGDIGHLEVWVCVWYYNSGRLSLR